MFQTNSLWTLYSSSQLTTYSTTNNLTILDVLATTKQRLMAVEWRADAEGRQFSEGWEAEYLSVECKETPDCFIYHQPIQIGSCAISHSSKLCEKVRLVSHDSDSR